MTTPPTHALRKTRSTVDLDLAVADVHAAGLLAHGLVERVPPVPEERVVEGIRADPRDGRDDIALVVGVDGQGHGLDASPAGSGQSADLCARLEVLVARTAVDGWGQEVDEARVMDGRFAIEPAWSRRGRVRRTRRRGWNSAAAGLADGVWSAHPTTDAATRATTSEGDAERPHASSRRMTGNRSSASGDPRTRGRSRSRASRRSSRPAVPRPPGTSRPRRSPVPRGPHRPPR